jgi:hypothetical protein
MCRVASALRFYRRNDALTFRRALVCDASAIDAIHELVRSYERQGRLDLAREILDPYLQKFGSS